MKTILFILTIELLLPLLSFGQKSNCNFDKYIKDNSTPQLAKHIYLDKEWDLNTDLEALALLDSLTANDKHSRPFYFRVVTKTYEKSDGYFSEALGLYGKEYVEENTKEFLSYFTLNECFSVTDLQTWVYIVMLEFGIIGEDNLDKQIMDNYIRALNQNCSDCSTEQKGILTKFSEGLKKEWTEFLKHIDN